MLGFHRFFVMISSLAFAGSANLALAGTIDDLLYQLKHGSTIDVRISAAEQLGHLADPAAIHPLGKVLAKEQGDPELRRVSAVALGEIGDKRAFPYLCKASDEGDSPAGLASITALGVVGHEQSSRVLTDIISHPLGHALTGQLDCSCTVHCEEPGPDNNPNGPPDNAESDGMSHLPPAHMSEFTQEQILNAAAALGPVGDASAVEPLIDLLDEEDWRLAGAAVASLGMIGDPEAIPTLRLMQNHPSPTVREAVAASLEFLETRESISAFSLSARVMAAGGASGAGGFVLGDINRLNVSLFKEPSLLDYYLERMGEGQ